MKFYEAYVPEVGAFGLAGQWGLLGQFATRREAERAVKAFVSQTVRLADYGYVMYDGKVVRTYRRRSFLGLP